MRDRNAGGRVGNELVSQAFVPCAVDKPGACALQLVTHAPPVPQICTLRSSSALHRFADGLTQRVAALAAGTGYCTTLT